MAQDGGDPGEPDLKVQVPGWSPLCVDVAIVWPHSSKAGRAAAIAEREKEMKYRVWRDQARVTATDFSPLVLESFGRFGAQSSQLVRRLATRAALDRGGSSKLEGRRWIELLGVALTQAQAEILLNA